MILKSYIITGILFIPHQFFVSGWLWMPIAMTVFLLMNLFCNSLLVEVHDVVGGTLPEMAYRIYGQKMRLFAEAVLFISQLAFGIPYIYFFVTQFGGEGGVLQCALSVNGNPNDCSDGFVMNKWYWMPIVMLMLVPLVWIRNMKSFAWTYTFIDIAAILSLVTLCVYAAKSSVEQGFDTTCIEPVGQYWVSGIGVAIYCFEG